MLLTSSGMSRLMLGRNCPFGALLWGKKDAFWVVHCEGSLKRYQECALKALRWEDPCACPPACVITVYWVFSYVGITLSTTDGLVGCKIASVGKNTPQVPLTKPTFLITDPFVSTLPSTKKKKQSKTKQKHHQSENQEKRTNFLSKHQRSDRLSALELN